MSLNFQGVRRLRVSETESWVFDGSEKGFERVYSLLSGRVFSYVYKKVRDRGLAEDLVQEIFLKLHRFRGSYRPGLPFLPWFWRLVRNATTDLLRKRTSRSEFETLLDTASGEQSRDADHVWPTLLAEAPDPEDQVIRKCLRKGLLRKLRGLTRLQQKVLWLRFVHDLSYAEVAARLGLTLASVKCLVQRARAAILLELGPDPALVFG